MRIAICEDDKNTLFFLEKQIEHCMAGISNSYICDCFFTADELLEKGESQYQIYVLDIEMDGTDGLELAERVRQKDQNAVIIFVTGYKEFTDKAFDVLAFQYLVKPIDEMRFKQVILKAIHFVQEKNNYIYFTNKKKMQLFYYEDIEFFESNKRKVIVHADTGVYEFYIKLGEVREQLQGNLFAQVHNSFIINLDKIREADRESVTLRSGVTIPITKKFHREFNKAYQNYVLMKCYRYDENRKKLQ